MSTAKEITTKIGSIKNTQKITRAMELVAASKMRKAQDRMAMSRPYAAKIRRVIGHVAMSHAEYRHPYMQERENIKRIGFIIVSTDRGLCGGLNVNLFRKTILEMKKYTDQNIPIDVCVIGRKAETFFGGMGAHIVGSVTQIGDRPAVQDIVGVVRILLDRFDSGDCDRIYICANEFVNTMIQKPFIRQLLPLEKETNVEMRAGKTEKHWDYLYEPDSAKTLLTMLLVRYIESQVYQAVIENIACEQAARMIAMKNATDNAKEIIKELQLAYNKARQASITREIAEIVGGAAALE
jgi:F-type H+-transporting ATPase subunit gamma